MNDINEIRRKFLDDCMEDTKYLGQCYCKGYYELFEVGGIYDYYGEINDIWVVADYRKDDPNMGRRFKKDEFGLTSLDIFSKYFVYGSEFRKMKLERLGVVSNQEVV